MFIMLKSATSLHYQRVEKKKATKHESIFATNITDKGPINKKSYKS